MRRRWPRGNEHENTTTGRELIVESHAPRQPRGETVFARELRDMLDTSGEPAPLDDLELKVAELKINGVRTPLQQALSPLHVALAG